MTDYSALRAEWDDLLRRRVELGSALALWTAILDGWIGWRPDARQTCGLGADARRARWERGIPLLAETGPDIPRDSIEDLLGASIERLAVVGPLEAEALERFAQAWDAGAIGPADLFPGTGKDGPTAVQERLGVEAHLLGFLAHAGLRPALEAFFEDTRELPDGVWTSGACPWCGGLAAFGDVVEDGRRRLSCHLCGGAWLAPRLRCPFCESWQSGDIVRLLGEGVEEGYFIEACRSCHGYLKGVDRRQRWNAGAALVEDWGSPHLDVYATRSGYWRATPSLCHLLPREP
ncbi:MAG TPA: formate dehydrogenase accessory protein FdhE [Candidatus Limnocylindrales bacterium]|nr:formate dehydrogenase accessory protein FdhE [Candidatus Limnocylindrales bacterium]